MATKKIDLDCFSAQIMNKILKMNKKDTLTITMGKSKVKLQRTE